jgi:TRAP-type C4-dicarboxylate transport system permease small subunit
MIQKCIKFLQSTSHVGMVLGTLAMIVMGIATVLNVLLRVVNIAMPGYMEFIEVVMIICILGAMAMAVFEKTQVAIDVLINRLSPDNQKGFEIFALVVNFVFWGVVGWATLDWLLKESFTTVTEILKIPQLPFNIYWLLGVFFFCLVYLIELLSIISQRRKKR